jgi:hypothetical protein
MIHRVPVWDDALDVAKVRHPFLNRHIWKDRARPDQFREPPQLPSLDQHSRAARGGKVSSKALNVEPAASLARQRCMDESCTDVLLHPACTRYTGQSGSRRVGAVG